MRGKGNKMADVRVYTERDVVEAIRKLDGSTARLACINIALTFIILLLTVVQVWSLFK